jgi:hypothetical protein
MVGTIREIAGMTLGMTRMIQQTKIRLLRCGAGLLVGLLLIGATAAPARAAQLEVVFKDGLWGAGIGALVGLAQVLSYKNPDNEYYRITTGASIGLIVGLAFGVAEISGAFASYDREHNQLAIGVPALQYSRDEHGAKVMVDFLQAKF